MSYAEGAAVITVSELNRRARAAVEGAFPLLWVAGEISNFTRAASGHCYFSLKDAAAQVRCVMFRHKAALLDWKPDNGMQVEVRALPSFYEARGEFQLGVETMRRSGLGALFEAFERLKARLQQEGLFEPARKRPIPPYPAAVGVVTSRKAAALRDVLTTLARRMPGVRVVLYPAPVQGQGAAELIAAAIRTASARAETDVLIVCRGGGSIEDLWSFNEEAVARAIAQSAIPVVSGVGHETDFTIADFVADARAPTPTAAAEMVSASRVELALRLRGLRDRLARNMQHALGARSQQLDYLGRRLLHPGRRLEAQARDLAQLGSRLRSAMARSLDAGGRRLAGLSAGLRGGRPALESLGTRQAALLQRLRASARHEMERRRLRLAGAAAHLAHLNPLAVLERGFSIVAREDGHIVRDAADVAVDAEVRLTFSRGSARARVKDVTKKD